MLLFPSPEALATQDGVCRLPAAESRELSAHSGNGHGISPVLSLGGEKKCIGTHLWSRKASRILFFIVFTAFVRMCESMCHISHCRAVDNLWELVPSSYHADLGWQAWWEMTWCQSRRCTERASVRGHNPGTLGSLGRCTVSSKSAWLHPESHLFLKTLKDFFSKKLPVAL